MVYLHPKPTKANSSCVGLDIYSFFSTYSFKHNLVTENETWMNAAGLKPTILLKA